MLSPAGNTTTTATSRGKLFLRGLFRSNSQQACDPIMVQAALNQAAKENLQIYKLRNPQDIRHHMHIYDAGVSYPEEFEGNEPLDYSCDQQPLEPTYAPSHTILPGMNAMDASDMSTARHHRAVASSTSTVDHTRQRPSSFYKQKSNRGYDSNGKLRHSDPQVTIRELERLAVTDSKEALQRLHALKLMPPSA